MDGLFKKTMSYLNEAAPQDEFIGKIVEVASVKLKILRKIAEGSQLGNSIEISFFVVIFRALGKSPGNL